MISKKYLSVESETKAIEQVIELKKQGIQEQNMYLIYNRGEKLSILGTKVDLETLEVNKDELKDEDNKNIFEKFTEFFTGESRVDEALSKADLNDEERKDVINQVKSGNIVILIDEIYGEHHNKICTEYKSSEDAKIDREKTGYEPFMSTGVDNIF